MQTTLEPVVALERPQTTLSNSDIIAELISKETATGKKDFRPQLKKWLICGGIVCGLGTTGFGGLALAAGSPEQGMPLLLIAFGFALLALLLIVPGWLYYAFGPRKLSEFCQLIESKGFSLATALFHQSNAGLENGYQLVTWDGEVVAQARVQNGIAYLTIGDQCFRKETVSGLCDIYEVVGGENSADPVVRYERKSIVGETFKNIRLVLSDGRSIEFDFAKQPTTSRSTYSIVFDGNRIGVLDKVGSNHAVLCERWVPHQVSALTYFALHTV